MLKELPFFPEWAQALPQYELLTVEGLCRETEGKVIVDIGCFIGGFTKVLAEVAKERGGKVYAIDLFKLAKEGTALWEIHQSNSVKQLLVLNLSYRGIADAVEIIEDDAKMVAKSFMDNTVDLVFLDAGHNYQAVKKDLELWYPKVKAGGIICGHDYECHEYDEQYINEDGHGDRHHGVIKAVNEFFETKGLKIQNDGNMKNRIWANRKETS